MRQPIAVVVLAAGAGTRMKSALPKVLHPVAGQPMLAARCVRVIVRPTPPQGFGSRTPGPDGQESTLQGWNGLNR